LVPVELRYETIVIQDGQLHVYRDVYNKNTNTEENLRAAFEAKRAAHGGLIQHSSAQDGGTIHVVWEGLTSSGST